MSLAEYKRKRNFRATREPASGGVQRKRIFVVQLHHASHRHFDFRLELNGVLKSWAIPKGPSFDPAIKRLAVEVEDHPVAYAKFAGDIPAGNYGAGHVDIFDHGTWEALGNAREMLAAGNLKFVLHGEILRGEWALVRTRPSASKPQWLLIKHRDDYAGARDANDFIDTRTDRPLAPGARQTTWTSAPRARKAASTRAAQAQTESIQSVPFAPELCRASTSVPIGDAWLHEVKWDGYRLLATVVAGKVRLWSRNGIEWTKKIPRIARAVAALKLKSAQFDGELIARKHDRADFNALQAALSAQDESELVYMLFDLPHLNGESLRDLPLHERKARLATLLKKNRDRHLRYSEHQIGHGKAAFDQAVKHGMEGIVSKRAVSTYVGARNGDWVKIKARQSDEFVIVGYTEPKGTRSGIGALLLAQFDAGALRYVGRAGTGFSDATLARLRKQPAADVVEAPSASTELLEAKDRRLAIWVRPKFVAEVYHQGLGRGGLLRQTAFKTLRQDKSVDDLRSEKEYNVAAVKRESANPTKKTQRPQYHSYANEAVVITHAERKVFADIGATKGDVADYYRAVAPLLLGEIGDRPLSVLRCPGGIGKACFFQKHVTAGLGAHVRSIAINEAASKEKSKREKYIFINDAQGLLELVQMNALEFHPWGAKVDDIEHADRIVFDLDPHAEVAWLRVRRAAVSLRKQLESIGLQSFMRTSGGKGLHIVVPLDPPAPWAAVKAFAQAVAQAMATLQPEEFVSVAGESNRQNKIFIDWLRNSRGATSVASYSLRARAGAGVAMPIAWNELARIHGGDAFTLRNAVAKIRKRKSDPWAELAQVKQQLPDLD